MPWEQSVHSLTQTSLWTTSKETHIPVYQDVFTYMPQVFSDIFFIWTGSKPNLENFLKELDVKHQSTKFEC